MFNAILICAACACVPLQPVPDSGIAVAQVGGGGTNPLHTLCPALLLEIQAYGLVIEAQTEAGNVIIGNIRRLEMLIEQLEALAPLTAQEQAALAELQAELASQQFQLDAKVAAVQLLTAEKNELEATYNALGCDAVSGVLP